METVPWKPFPADGKPPVAPTVPWPAPLGAPRGPPAASTSPEAHSQRWRGDHACQIGPGRVGEGMDVARQPASSITMATPPHPSWDAARPDDEVISGGERGRQAGSGDLRGLAGTQTCPPPSRAAPGKPGPPVLDPPTSLHRRGWAALPISIRLVVPARRFSEPQNPRCAEQSRPHSSLRLQSTASGTGTEGPYGQSHPQKQGRGWS